MSNDKRRANATKAGFHVTPFQVGKDFTGHYLPSFLCNQHACFAKSECIMIYFKMFLKDHHLEFYSPIDSKNNLNLYLGMTYPPAKFDVN